MKTYKNMIHLRVKIKSILQTCSLFPFPASLPQLGAMISAEPTVLEACGSFIPKPRNLKTLLLHQQAKGLIRVKGILWVVCMNI